MLLKPHGKIDLEHRAFLLCSTPTGSIVVGGMDDTRLTVIAPDMATTHCIDLRSTATAISLRPSKPLLAWVDGNTGLLRVQKIDGAPVAEMAPPVLAPGTSKSVKQGFDACYFDESGDFLWLVAPVGDKDVESQLLRTSDWVPVEKRTIEAKHVGSSSSLHGTTRSDVISLW